MWAFVFCRTHTPDGVFLPLPLSIMLRWLVRCATLSAMLAFVLIVLVISMVHFVGFIHQIRPVRVLQAIVRFAMLNKVLKPEPSPPVITSRSTCR